MSDYKKEYVYPIKQSGRQYSSVEELIKGEGINMTTFKEKLDGILMGLTEDWTGNSVVIDREELDQTAKEIMQLIHDDCRKEANEESTMYHPYEERFVQAFQKRLKECGGAV